MHKDKWNFLGEGDGVNNLAGQALVSGAIFSTPSTTLSPAKQTHRQIWRVKKGRCMGNTACRHAQSFEQVVFHCL